MSQSKPAPAKQRILIVEDHPLYRDAVLRLINYQADLVCCGEADSCRTGYEAAARLKPDLVLLDLRLHKEDGMELLKRLRTLRPDLPVLVLSQREDTLHALPALRAGARGYIMKEEVTKELLTAIRSVLQGNVYVNQRLYGMVMSKVSSGCGAGAGPGDKLSDRELQLFQLFGSGLGSRQIAEQLDLSVKTVEAHRENIKHKLGLPDAATLARVAQEWLRDSGE